jgi:hypothetical protein
MGFATGTTAPRFGLVVRRWASAVLVRMPGMSGAGASASRGAVGPASPMTIATSGAAIVATNAIGPRTSMAAAGAGFLSTSLSPPETASRSHRSRMCSGGAGDIGSLPPDTLTGPRHPSALTGQSSSRLQQLNPLGLTRSERGTAPLHGDTLQPEEGASHSTSPANLRPSRVRSSGSTAPRPPREGCSREGRWAIRAPRGARSRFAQSTSSLTRDRSALCVDRLQPPSGKLCALHSVEAAHPRVA